FIRGYVFGKEKSTYLYKTRKIKQTSLHMRHDVCFGGDWWRICEGIAFKEVHSNKYHNFCNVDILSIQNSDTGQWHIQCHYFYRHSFTAGALFVDADVASFVRPCVG